MFDARHDCVQCRHPLMLHAAPAPALQVVNAPATAVRPPRAATAAAAAAAASTSEAEEPASADTGDEVLLHPICETERSRFAARAKRNAEHATEVRESTPLVRNRIHIHVLAYPLDEPLLKAFVAHLKAVGEKEPEPVRRPHSFTALLNRLRVPLVLSALTHAASACAGSCCAVPCRTV